MTKSQFIPLSRRTVLTGAAATALSSRLAAPALAQSQNTDRIIFAMSQEPVQFNPLLYVNTGTENVPESCMFDALWDVNDNGEFVPNLAAEIPTRANGGISADGLIWRGAAADGKWAACWLAGTRLVAALTVGLPRDLLQARRLIEAGAAVDPGRLADPSVPVRDCAVA